MVLSRRPITGTRLLTLITIFKCSAEVGPTGTAYLSTGSRRRAGSRRVLTERFFASDPGPRSRAGRVLSEGRGHEAFARVFERRALVGLPIISLRRGAGNADCWREARHQLSHGG